MTGALDTLRQDLIANRAMSATEKPTLFRMLRKVLVAHFYNPSFMCVFWYRVNRFMYLRKIPFWKLLNARRRYWFGNDIPCFATIGAGFRVAHLSDIAISTVAVVGTGVTIYNGVTLGAKWIDRASAKAPRLGDGVVVFTGAKLIGGITIGDRSVVGALTLCTKDVPADSVVYGIPPNQTVKPRGAALPDEGAGDILG